MGKILAKYCSDCGKPLENENSKFCNDCGAQQDTTLPGEKQDSVRIVRGPEEKNPFLAIVCSFFIPGLGQVYNGETAKGVGIFAGTLIGLFLLIIPGLIVWIFGWYDAYMTATRMNNQEIPFIPTNTAHMIIFFILVVIITTIVIFLVVVSAMAVIFGSLARGMH
jgi:TM2 domain-containing membrane protein YozV